MPKTYSNPGPLAFTAIIQKAEPDNAYIEFPYDLKETFGVGNLVPYKATFDGRVSYQGSLAKMGNPKAMIMLRKDIRAELGKNPGDSVDLVVELDDKPREIAIPDDLKQALQTAGLLEVFEKLAYTHRKEYSRWIEEAKKLETRQNRVAKAIGMIREKAGL